MKFEWDILKEISNLKKHKVSFIDSTETFFDPVGFELRDLKHSNNEARHYWVGKAKDGRILTTWFTMRNETIRIIGSAEWRKFRRYYYETTKAK